jgi:Phage integrase, N-terminal SAM-like domain
MVRTARCLAIRGGVMPKMFTGQVLIPAEQLDEYLKTLAAAEKAREPFRRYLAELLGDFTTYLSEQYSARTVRKHGWIVEVFLDFLCRHTDVERLEDVTRGMVNTHFRRWYKGHVLDAATPNDLRVALRKFFHFLATEKGIQNPKVLDALK